MQWLSCDDRSSANVPKDVRAVKTFDGWGEMGGAASSPFPETRSQMEKAIPGLVRLSDPGPRKRSLKLGKGGVDPTVKILRSAGLLPAWMVLYERRTSLGTEAGAVVWIR